MKKLLTIIFALVLFLFSPGISSAQGSVKAEFDSILYAFVDIDNFSTLTVTPGSNEVGLESEVKVRILDRNGSPIPGHTIILYVTDPSGTVIFSQPTISDADGYAIGSAKGMFEGAFIIRAYDSTYPEGNISIHSTDTLYTFPIPTPTLLDEPYYTKGSSNKIYWDKLSGLSEYEYYLQVATDSSFVNIVGNSGWVSSLAYEFQNLNSAQMYFYRIKARNEGGAESSWSSIQFSVQDTLAPVIKVQEITRLGSEENPSSITVKFTVTEDLSLKKVSFFCVQSNGTWEECGTIENSGTQYFVNIPLSDLQRGPLFSFLDKYTFCIEAHDEAGNTSQNCDAQINIDEYVETPVPIFTNVINSIIKRVNDALQDIENSIVKILSSTRLILLDLLSIILLVLFSLFTIFIVTGSASLLPVFILLALLKLLNIIGLRGHGKPMGMVYNSVTKKPIQFATVHIFDGMNRLIRKDITNFKGEFFGDLKVGKYRIMISRYGYLYPSQLVKGKEDRKLGDVYKSEYINITKNKEIYMIVPIDPVNLKDPGVLKVWEARKARLAKSLNFLLLVIGFSLSTYIFQKEPNILRILILLIYIPIIGVYLKGVVPIRWRVG